MTHIIKIPVLALLFLLWAPALSAADNNNEPSMPAPLKNLAEEGAQLHYLGNEYGLDGWAAIKGGQEQFFYVTEDGEALVMGLLFDKSGKAITVRQLKALQEGTAGESLNMLADDNLQKSELSRKEFKTPAEQLFEDVKNANWITLGDPDAPVIYSFMDPQCPHCHALMADLRENHIPNGLVQVRLIPVGFKPESLRQAAFLLAAANPEERWYRHLEGDEEALPVTPDINTQGIQRNLAVMQSWNLNVTPLTVYRAQNGKVKIIRGRVQDLSQLLADLPG